MKNKILIHFLIATFFATVFMCIGVGIGFNVADNAARKNVGEDSVNQLILLVERDCSERVTSHHYSKKYELLIIRTENNTYHFKLTKVAPFRYEWEYVEL